MRGAEQGTQPPASPSSCPPPPGRATCRAGVSVPSTSKRHSTRPRAAAIPQSLPERRGGPGAGLRRGAIVRPALREVPGSRGQVAGGGAAPGPGTAPRVGSSPAASGHRVRWGF